MPTVVELIVSWIVTNALTFGIILLDERKILSADQLERAWPPSSRDAAIIAFGPLCLPVHFIKTRTRLSLVGLSWGLLKGLLLATLALAIVLFGGGLVLDAVFTALGFPDSG